MLWFVVPLTDSKLGMMKNLSAVLQLLTLCYLICTANAGCHWDKRLNDDCPYEEAAKYEGPPGEIVNGKPSLSADVSIDQSAGIDAMLDIITGAIGTIPEVGALLAGFFTSFRTIFGQSSTNEALEAFYNAIKNEVDAIINYVDEKVLELEVNYIKSTLGGFEYAALDCSKYSQAVDMKTCLIAIREDLIGQYLIFFPSVPSDPTPEDVFEQGPLLEQLIPMWRHYCDIFLAVTLELITSLRQLGNEADAKTLTEELSLIHI